MFFTCLAGMATSSAGSPQGPLEVSPLLMPAPTDTVWVSEAPEAKRTLDEHRVTIDGQPATGRDIQLGPGARCQWEMNMPEPGEYLISLCLGLADKCAGQFGYVVGDEELVAPVFRGPRPEEGSYAPMSRAYRITVRPGQTRTRFFLRGDGLLFDRADVARLNQPVAGRDGRLQALAGSSYRTVLSSGACVVLVPACEPESSIARALAQRLQLPTVAEPELSAPFPTYPVTDAQVNPDTHLIVLSAGGGGPIVQALRRAGWLPENHAIPGPGGYVIRTIARPFRGQANVIALSSSDADGLTKAAAAFQPRRDEKSQQWVWDKFLVDVPAERWGALRPWYYKVADNDPLWARLREEATQPIAGLKGGGRARAYLQRTASYGRQYYLTGNVRFAEMFRTYILKMEEEDIFGLPGTADSHMELYGLMQAWDQVEEASVFSDAERLRIANYLLIRCIEGHEGFDRIHAMYREYIGPVRLRHNHQTILGRGLMQGYLYYSRLYDLGRANIWKGFCDDLAVNATWWGHAPENSPNYESLTYLEQTDLLHYQGLSTRGQEGTATWPQAALRFAAVRDVFSLPACYGDCWDARQAATLQFYTILRDDWDWPAAQYLIDHLIRGYRAVAKDHEHASELYAYLHGSTDVGGLLPPPDQARARQALQPLTGLYAVPMAEPYYRLIAGQLGHEPFWKAAGGRPANPVPADRAAYKIQYRSGWGFDDEYLLFETIGWTDHGHYDLGTLVQYCAGGRLWIVDHGYTNIGVEHHSTLDVKRDGQPAWTNYPHHKGRWGHFRTGSQIFELVKVQSPPSGTPGPFHVIARAADIAGAVWQRSLQGGGGAPLVVEDTLTAEQPGEYQIIFRLRLLGDVQGQDGRWTVRQQGATLPVALDLASGDHAVIGPWRPDGHASNKGAYPWYPYGTKDGIPQTIEWTRTVHLTPGQPTTFRATLGPVEKD